MRSVRLALELASPCGMYRGQHLRADREPARACLTVAAYHTRSERAPTLACETALDATHMRATALAHTRMLAHGAPRALSADFAGGFALALVCVALTLSSACATLAYLS